MPPLPPPQLDTDHLWKWFLAFHAHAATVPRMKQSLDHLPEGKRRELEFVVGVIREGFAKAVAHRKQPRFRVEKLLKIILFGSHARGDWVDDLVTVTSDSAALRSVRFAQSGFTSSTGPTPSAVASS